MFQFNNQLFYPFYLFSGQQPLAFHSPQLYNQNYTIKYPTAFYNPQICHQNQINQVQRQQPNINILNEQNGLEEVEVKITNSNKKKTIKKKKNNKKNIDLKKQTLDQAERLKRKLANRPKTYKTQNKMYMQTNLRELGIIDSKRVLRKKKRHNKKHRNKQQPIITNLINQKQIQQAVKGQSCQNTIKLQKLEIKQLQMKQQFIASLSFYDPQAQIPIKIGSITAEQIQNKIKNLNSRRIIQESD